MGFMASHFVIITVKIHFPIDFRKTVWMAYSFYRGNSLGTSEFWSTDFVFMIVHGFYEIILFHIYFKESYRSSYSFQVIC